MGNIKKNLGYQMAYRILSVITPLITSPIISRALGADKLGIYSATQAYANYFMFFAMLGIEYYGQRTIAASNTNEEKEELFWEIYLVQCISSSIAIFVYYGSVFFISRDRFVISIIQGMWVISCLFDINWFFFGIEDFKTTVTRNFVVKCITVIGIVFLIRSPDDLYIYALLMAGSTAVSQALLWVALFHKIRFKRVDLNCAKIHFRPIIRLFLPIIASSVYHVMDKTMLDMFSTENEVGYYYAADKIINIPLGLITAIGIVILPRVSGMLNKAPKEKITKLLEGSAELSLCMSSAIGFGIVTIAQKFVPFFFGKGYEKCISLLILFVPILIVKSLSNIVDQEYLIPSKKDTQYTLAVVSGAVTNLIFNSLLIPPLGSIGSTIGTFIAEFVVLMVSIIFSWKNVNFVKMFLKEIWYFIPGLIMMIMIWATSKYVYNYFGTFFGLIICIFLGAAIYGGICCFVWKYIKRDSIFRPYLNKISHKYVG